MLIHCLLLNASDFTQRLQAISVKLREIEVSLKTIEAELIAIGEKLTEIGKRLEALQALLSGKPGTEKEKTATETPLQPLDLKTVQVEADGTIAKANRASIFGKPQDGGNEGKDCPVFNYYSMGRIQDGHYSIIEKHPTRNTTSKRLETVKRCNEDSKAGKVNNEAFTIYGEQKDFDLYKVAIGGEDSPIAQRLNRKIENIKTVETVLNTEIEQRKEEGHKPKLHAWATDTISAGFDIANVANVDTQYVAVLDHGDANLAGAMPLFYGGASTQEEAILEATDGFMRLNYIQDVYQGGFFDVPELGAIVLRDVQVYKPKSSDKGLLQDPPRINIIDAALYDYDRSYQNVPSGFNNYSDKDRYRDPSYKPENYDPEKDQAPETVRNLASIKGGLDQHKGNEAMLAYLENEMKALKKGRWQKFTVDNKPGSDLWKENTKAKIRAIFASAADQGIKNIVFGLIGCGVFQNPSDEVAKLFGEVLFNEGYAYLFDHIAYANPAYFFNPQKDPYFINMLKEGVKKIRGEKVDIDAKYLSKGITNP